MISLFQLQMNAINSLGTQLVTFCYKMEARRPSNRGQGFPKAEEHLSKAQLHPEKMDFQGSSFRGQMWIVQADYWIEMLTIMGKTVT